MDLSWVESLGVLGAIHLIVWLIAMVSIIGGKRSFGSKVLWSLVVFFFPCVGLIVYLLLGRNPRDL